MFRLVIPLSSPVREIAVTSSEPASLSSASRLVLVAAMMLWELLRCAAEYEVLNLTLGIETVLRRRCAIASTQVGRFGE
jgi:hypothetical protein